MQWLCICIRIVCLSQFARAATLIHAPKYHRFTQGRNFVNATKIYPEYSSFLVVNNLIYMIEVVYLWLKSDSIVSNPQTCIWNSMLGAFSCDITVVSNDVIMQRTQRCQGLCDPRQLNPYIAIWLARALRALEASQHVIGLVCYPKTYELVCYPRTYGTLQFTKNWKIARKSIENCISG